MTAMMTPFIGTQSDSNGITCSCGQGPDPSCVGLTLMHGGEDTLAPTCPFATPRTEWPGSPQRKLTAQEEQQLFRELRLLEQRRTELVTDDRRVVRDADRCEAIRVSCRACSLRRHLGECFFKLAVSVARSFATNYQDIDDLVGQACVTLMRALELFDVERGYRFSTYATRAIRTELSRFVVRTRQRSMVTFDVSKLDYHVPATSDRRHPGPATFCALEDLLSDLDVREAEIVRSRFGLKDRPGCETLQSVANRLGMSRERVRQLERKALGKLRELAARDDRVTTFESVCN